ncbi:hypothetical protein ABAC460_18110, partial [Asticcacaulis sp. AC460]|uniref:calcium-binding protein n=1 Tax=Asticcacaulis sp. AC460 TaxID=1282360 RepID=UPI0003C3DF90
IYTYGGNDALALYVDGTAWVDAGSGDDQVTIGGSGSHTVYGNVGNDRLTHRENLIDDGVATLDGGAGDDVLTGLTGANDLLYGASGQDYLYVEDNNRAYGGLDNDVYEVGADVTDQADVTITEYAGGGYDTIRANYDTYTFAANIEAYETTGNKNFRAYGNDAANSVVSANGNDWFDMKGGHDAVNAGRGNDTIWGGTGNDSLEGGYGADLIYGGVGNDVLTSYRLYDIGSMSNNDTIYGGDGDDYIDGGYDENLLYGEAGNDILGSIGGYGDMYGGTGNDTYITENNGSNIHEAAGAGIDLIQYYGPYMIMPENVENLVFIYHPQGTSMDRYDTTQVYGNDLNNAITGDRDANIIEGNGGNDVIFAGDANDTVRGGEGDDRLYGEKHFDLMYGDAGNDSLSGGDHDDFLYGGTGNDVLQGGADNDFVNGESGNDQVFGGTGNDTLTGSTGNDILNGEGGNDVIRAGSHDDMVYGYDGDDRLQGDSGADNQYGGLGNDLFIFTATSDSNISTGVDKLWDFTAGQDRIDLSLMDANTLLSGNQAFNMHGPAAGQAGNVWIQYNPATSTSPQSVSVFGDVNGDGGADFRIDVMYVNTLSTTDFIF